jgi:hypothetical protein
VVAGRLEIPVESDTKGFGDRLKAAIEKETRNVVAKIGVEVDENHLRRKLEDAVDKAAAGVKARIEVEVDTKKAKAQLAALDAKVKVKVEGLTDDVKRQGLIAQLFAKRNPIKYPGEANKRGFLASLLAAQVEGQAAARKKPIRIPFAAPENFRSTIMPLFYLAIASVIQPAIAAIVGGIGGLLPMIGNLATSVQTLAIGPASLVGLAGGFIATTLAIKALKGNVEDLPKPLRDVRKELESLQKPWKAIQTDTAVAFWKQLRGEIKPTADKLLPLLNDGMSSFGKTTGGIAKDLAEWARTPLFNGQFMRLLASGDVLLGSFGKALLGLAKGFMNIADAATIVVGGPGGDSLLGRFSKFIDGIGTWAAKIAAPGKEAQDFAESLGYAADKAGQLWGMVKDLSAGLVGIFRAGRDSGDELLGTLERVISNWRDWVESDMGQGEIKDWFDAVKPITQEAGRLIAEIGKSILRLAKDPNTATMLRTIREELLPTLETFLSNLGKSLGPEVIQFFINLLGVLTDMSEAGGPLAKGLSYINVALGGLSDWLRANPDIAAKLGTVLGALLAFRALAFIGNVTGILTLFSGLSSALKGGGLLQLAGLTAVILPFTGALGDMNPALQGAVSALGAFLTLRSSIPAMQGIMGTISKAFDGVRLQAMYAADGYKAASEKFRSTGSSGFGAAARAVGTTAKSGLRGALSGIGTLIGGAALGGPVGLAIGAASVAVGIWAQKHAEASQKAAEYKAWVEQLAGTLDKETGALTEASKAAVANKLIHEGTAEAARKLGVSMSDLTEASIGNADAASRVRKALADNIKKFIESDAAATDFKGALKGAGVSLDAFAAAQVTGGDTAKDMRKKVLDAARAAGIHGIELDSLWAKLEGVTRANQDLAKKVGAESQATKDATARQLLFNEMMGKAKGNIDKVTQALRLLPAGKTTTVKGLTADAEAKLKALGYKVQHMPNGTTRVTATTSTAKAEADLRWLARNRTAHIQAVYTGDGRSTAGGITRENGGIVQFLNGGISRMGQAVQSFANGTENHIAQIAKAGTWRLWAEPETGGEAYIPLAGSKRKRSMEILREVADRFGMVVAPKVSAIADSLAARDQGMNRVAAFAAGAMRTTNDLRDAAGGPRVVFESGAITIANPVPETASESITKTTRKVGEFGLWGSE